jgi:hypothetical protein
MSKISAPFPVKKLPDNSTIEIKSADSPSISQSVKLVGDTFKLSQELTENMKEYLLVEASNGKATVYQAYKKNKKSDLLGTIVLRLFTAKSPSSALPPALYLENHVVAPLSRGQGIGPKLVESALKEIPINSPVAVHFAKDPKGDEIEKWGFSGFSKLESPLQFAAISAKYPDWKDYIQNVEKLFKQLRIPIFLYMRSGLAKT